MRVAYRITRGILAGTALTALTLFAGWHLLVFRMRCVYRIETEGKKP